MIDIDHYPSPELRTFIMRKKAVALLLAVLLFALAAYNLVRWSLDIYRVAYAGAVIASRPPLVAPILP